jgi:hypothetical protein
MFKQAHTRKTVFRVQAEPGLLCSGGLGYEEYTGRYFFQEDERDQLEESKHRIGQSTCRIHQNSIYPCRFLFLSCLLFFCDLSPHAAPRISRFGNRSERRESRYRDSIPTSLIQYNQSTLATYTNIL